MSSLHESLSKFSSKYFCTFLRTYGNKTSFFVIRIKQIKKSINKLVKDYVMYNKRCKRWLLKS